MRKPMYRIYEATIPGESGTFRIAVSELREISLREEIQTGKRDLILLSLLAETQDRNEARSMGYEM